jgi:hypothetical protein
MRPGIGLVESCIETASRRNESSTDWTSAYDEDINGLRRGSSVHCDDRMSCF